MKAVTVRFSDQEHERLTKLSQSLERSSNELVREAVRRYFKEQESSN